MTLNASKSKKICDEETGACTWQAHFYRDFETGDERDYQFVEGVLDQYYLSGSYQVSKDGTDTFKGNSIVFPVAMGHSFDA